MAKLLAVAAALFGATALSGCGPKPLTSDQTCQTAVYRLSDGRILDIAPAAGKDLRWRLLDGRTGLLSAKANWSSTLGWTGQADGVSVRLPACGGDEISFTDKGGKPVTGTKVPLEITDTTFKVDGATLAGRLVMPAGARHAPLMVEVHGSEKTPATVYYYTQRMFPAQGVAVFVYDKRGTGRSTGRYTQDFQVLARDAAEAMKAARTLAGPRASRVGFEGGSQGGWIAPLAATLTPADFVIVGYGLADSPQHENRDEVLQDFAAKHYGPDVTAHAMEVVEAVDAVMISHFKSGYERLDAVKAKYGKEPWFKDIQGDYTGQVLKFPTWLMPVLGPMFDVHTPFAYDPMPVLRRQNAPTLWVLAGDDHDAPIAETQRRLTALAAEGRPFMVMLFPDTEHGILEFVTGPDGKRADTRYAEGYFQSAIDWAKGGLRGTYGRGQVIAQQVIPDAPAEVANRPMPPARPSGMRGTRPLLPTG